MAELMLLNPRKRGAKRRKATPAQLRALAKGRATRKRNALARNPAPVRRKASVMRAAASNPRRRRAARNPIGMSGIVGQLMSAAQGAAGALAVDAVMTYVPLPTMLTSGNMKHVTRAGLAIGLGLVGKKFLGRTAGKMAEGAITVAAYQAAKGLLGGMGMNLAYMSPAQSFAPNAPGMLPNPGMAEYINSFQNSGMGEYVSGGYGGNGY